MKHTFTSSWFPKGLIGPELIAKMRTWRHSGFHVYVGPSILQKEDVVRVGLYIVRAPASSSRLQLTQDGLLKYLAKGSLSNDRCDTLFEPKGQIFDSLEWIAKVTSHIPEKGSQLVHYYGAYSNAHRGRRAKLGDSSVARTHCNKEAQSETEWTKLRRKSWAALIRLVYEADPLLCPKCRNQMKIVSVIKDGPVIDKILAHLQYKFEPLPLAAVRPPPDTPPEWDSFSAD
ncbi:transposase [bacterium]|nr:transposase [bacterium]